MKRAPFRKDVRDASERARSADAAAPYYVSVNGRDRVELVRHARAAGLRNLPESSATELTDVEAAVIREHQRRHRDIVEQARVELHALTAQFDQVEQSLPVPRDMKVIAHNAEAAIEHDLSADASLIPLRQEQQRRRRVQSNFIREHDLSRDAAYPASHVWHLGVVAVIVAIESILNAAFFAGASRLGLVGGLLAAMGVALINAVLGLLAGYFPFRWRHHLEPRLRRLAACGVGLSIVLIVDFNWAVARYRDAAATGAGQIQVGDVLHLAAATSPQSLGLFLLGTLSALFCVRKGFTLDDRVPDFGHHDREFRAADRAYADHHQSLQRCVLEHADRVPESCRSLTKRAADDVDQLGQIVVKVRRALEAYEAERERIGRWCLQYLRRYRAENEAVRTTRTPVYFSDYPDFPSQVAADAIAEFQERLDRAGARLSALKEASDRMVFGQSDRVAAARARFSTFVRHALRVADAGRGDGSSSEIDGGEGEEVRLS